MVYLSYLNSSRLITVIILGPTDGLSLWTLEAELVVSIRIAPLRPNHRAAAQERDIGSIDRRVVRLHDVTEDKHLLLGSLYADR